MRTRTSRVLAGAGLTVVSVLMGGGWAGAAASNCVVPQTLQEPACVVVPTVAGDASTVAPSAAPTGDATPGGTAPVASAPTSLPFTGADVEELAVIGAGAVIVGTLLLRRRRRTGA